METSNFSESGSDPRAVAISRSRPRGWNGRVYEKLAPSWALIRLATLSEAEYTRRYNEEVLSKLDAGEVYGELGKDAILLCQGRVHIVLHGPGPVSRGAFSFGLRCGRRDQGQGGHL